MAALTFLALGSLNLQNIQPKIGESKHISSTSGLNDTYYFHLDAWVRDEPNDHAYVKND